MREVVVHLSKDLVSRYGIKRFPVRKGDMVRIIKGDSEKDEKLNIRGKEGKVVKVLKDENKVIVENVNISKADGKMKPKKLDPSALVITKVILEDKRRKERLARLASMRNKVVEEESPAEQPQPTAQVEQGSEEETGEVNKGE